MRRWGGEVGMLEGGKVERPGGGKLGRGVREVGRSGGGEGRGSWMVGRWEGAKVRRWGVGKVRMLGAGRWEVGRWGGG